MLAEIATHRGEFDSVSAFVEEARTLAESQANYTLLIKALQTAAYAAFVQQAFETSEQLCQRALELCHRTGFREGEAQAHKLLGAVYGRLFNVESARSHYEHADALYTTLGKIQGQAAIKINMGILYNLLGKYRDAIVAFRQAGQLFEELQDLRGQLVSDINLSAVAIFQEDYATAKDAAQRSLNLAREMQSVHLEATALSNLGEAEREMGDHDSALAYIEKGLSIRRSLDSQPADLGHDLCQLTLTHLCRGDLAAARQTSDELLAVLTAGETGMLHPQQMWWTAAQVYRASGDTQRAGELLQTAHTRLEEKAEAIPDTESRESFRQLRFNREIVAAYAQDVWP
jgi:tetratricopeptide (TPR) repeat protein